jgi:hypothetical protein
LNVAVAVPLRYGWRVVESTVSVSSTAPPSFVPSGTVAVTV